MIGFVAKTPVVGGWVELTPIHRDGMEMRVFEYGGIRVVSSLDIMEMPDGNGTGPQWLISISYRGKRAGPQQVERALRAFGMTEAEQDNHEPGVARKYFLVCDPSLRVTCECKTDELMVVESDGYRWTTPVDGPCRGCAYEHRHGKPCPLHKGNAVIERRPESVYANRRST